MDSIRTRTFEFQLMLLNFQLVLLSFQLVTRNSCFTISRQIYIWSTCCVNLPNMATFLFKMESFGLSFQLFTGSISTSTFFSMMMSSLLLLFSVTITSFKLNFTDSASQFEVADILNCAMTRSIVTFFY